MRTKPLRPKEYWLDLPVQNLPTLKSHTRDHLKDLRLLTISDLVKRCINKKKGYDPIDRRGFGVASNYDVAALLHRRGFLSKAAFAKVKLPEWKHRNLIDEEIGEMKDVLVSKFKWSEDAKFLILHTTNIGRRKSRGQFFYATRDQTDMVMGWESITVGDLVKRFVRVTSYGKTIFWTTGHYGSHWYRRDRLSQALHECLPEIEKFLVDNYFLEKSTEPA